MGMISEATEEAVLFEARAVLVNRLRRAGQEVEASRVAFASPFSSHDSEVAFHYARGRQSGIGSSIEEIDKMLEEL